MKDRIEKRPIPLPRIGTHDYVLIALSLLCILVYSSYIIIRDRKRMKTPELMMLSLLITLFGALVAFSIANIPTGLGCRVLTAMIQFLFLSVLFWSSAIGINITYTIYRMRPVSSSFKKYLRCCVYTQGIPLLLVLITFGLSEAYKDDSDFKVYREGQFCFIQQEEVIYGLFLGPVYFAVLSNISLCVACIIKVQKSMGVAAHDKNRWKKNVITCFKLSATLGVSWIFLLFITAFPYNGVLADIFQIVIELQGVLVVAANVLSWKCFTKAQTSYKSRFSNDKSTVSTSNGKSTELTSVNLRQ